MLNMRNGISIKKNHSSFTHWCKIATNDNLNSQIICIKQYFKSVEITDDTSQ